MVFNGQHGTCERNANCQCFPKWTGVDCSLRTCPADIAWVGPVVAANGEKRDENHSISFLLLKFIRFASGGGVLA